MMLEKDGGNKVKLRLVAMLMAVMFLLSACHPLRTCASCGREFRGSAYSGVFGQIMRADCARTYWMPIDYRNFRIR